MCRSMVDIQSPTAEIRRGKKKIEERRKKLQGKNIMVCPITYGNHNKLYLDTVLCLETFGKQKVRACKLFCTITDYWLQIAWHCKLALVTMLSCDGCPNVPCLENRNDCSVKPLWLQLLLFLVAGLEFGLRFPDMKWLKLHVGFLAYKIINVLRSRLQSLNLTVSLRCCITNNCTDVWCFLCDRRTFYHLHALWTLLHTHIYK